MTKDEIRDRLVELLSQKGFGVEGATIAADYLIAHGVTFGEDTNVPTGWITVSERSPEESGYYLVSHKHGCVCIRLYNERCGDMFAKFGNDPVTHWMPLPEPPKEET